MSDINEIDVFGNNPATDETITNDGEERKEYEFFANLCIPFKYRGRVINLTLPSNKILDEMKLRDESDGPLAKAQNQFYKSLMAAATELEPGERKEVPNIRVELYRAPVGDNKANAQGDTDTEINLGF